MRLRLAIGQQFVTDKKGILSQQGMLDIAEFLEASEIIMYLIFLILKKRGLLTELLSYPNDTLSLNLTQVFHRNTERSQSNRFMI